MDMYDRAAELVANGAARLDEIEPGWFDQINLETLDTSWYQECPVGQLNGSYNRYVGKYLREDEMPEDLGFNCTNEVPYEVLDEVWAEMIERRIDEQRASEVIQENR